MSNTDLKKKSWIYNDFTGTDEMRALQTRLEETEKQMARILQAMQTVSSKMTNVSDDSKEVPVCTCIWISCSINISDSLFITTMQLKNNISL